MIQNDAHKDAEIIKTCNRFKLQDLCKKKINTLTLLKRVLNEK